MKFKDIVVKDNMTFFNEDEFAEKVLYNGVQTLAVYELQQTNQKGNGFDTQGSSDSSYFWVVLERMPKAGDKIEYNSMTYHVSKVVEQGSGVYKVEVTSNESPLSGRMAGRWSS